MSAGGGNCRGGAAAWTRSVGVRVVVGLVWLVVALAVPAALPALAVAAPASPGATVAARSAGTPCASSARACMDISTHQAWLTDGAGHVIYGPVPARGGTAHAPTPVGTFHVIFKDAHYYSKEFNAPMPYAVFFYPGDAFHADNTGINSNGCIHLGSAAAQRFYTTLQVGDTVQVRG
jgi:hypothetical protein